MPTAVNDVIKMKVFPKGQVVIPVSLRKKYKIAIGDHIQVIPSNDGILLKPSPKKEKIETITETLYGIFRKYANGKHTPGKKEIIEATEKGFLEGLDK